MHKCVKISVQVGKKKDFLPTMVQTARTYGLEGVGQQIDMHTVSIIVCGMLNDVELFLDDIYKVSKTYVLDNIIVESFVKDRDYRGVFRIIE
jgi:hypothetical protein